MSSIATFFDEAGEDEYPLSEPEYRQAYTELASLVREKGGDFYIVRDQSTYLGANRFSGGWHFDGQHFKRVDKPVSVDLIFNKGNFVGDAHACVHNDPHFEALCTNKWYSYLTFPESHSQTKLVKTDIGFTRALNAMTTPIIVVKPLDGEEGKGVWIGPKEEARSHIPGYPCILQEFIDTRSGIPGIVEGPHDLRMIGIAGDIVVSYIRTPPTGSLRANVALGGREIEVEPEDLPEQAEEIFEKVDEQLEHFPSRVYSVDVGRTTQGQWKIIEINAKPGLSTIKRGGQYPRFMTKLADTLLSVR